MAESATILIVDDTEQNIRLLAHILKKEGHEVLAAFSGEDGLQLIEKKKPDIILLDVMMPVMNGFEVCRELKKRPETREIPVIFLSALSETESKMKGFKAGGVDYITKPFQREEILGRIDLHVSLTRLRNQLRQRDERMRQMAGKVRQSISHILELARQLEKNAGSTPPEEQKKICRTIGENGKEIQNLVKDLLREKSMERGGRRR